MNVTLSEAVLTSKSASKLLTVVFLRSLPTAAAPDPLPPVIVILGTSLRSYPPERISIFSNLPFSTIA